MTSFSKTNEIIETRKSRIQDPDGCMTPSSNLLTIFPPPKNADVLVGLIADRQGRPICGVDASPFSRRL